MIAFISTNSGLVHLIEGRGLCAQILYFRFFIKGCTRIGTGGPLGVSVLTIISIYTSTTLSSLRVASLYRTCTLFGFTLKRIARRVLWSQFSRALLGGHFGPMAFITLLGGHHYHRAVALRSLVFLTNPVKPDNHDPGKEITDSEGN